MRRTILALLFIAVPQYAFASCGSSSCPIDLSAFGGGRFTLDLSWQYIDQNQPRIGTRTARIGEIPSDHDEIRTINRITALQFGYRASDRLELSVTAPFVSRSHTHFDNESQEIERWNFAARGDVVTQARVRMTDHVWAIGGIKLPTGARNEPAVGGGEIGEVTIEPGTGSTDFIGGMAWRSSVLRETALAGSMGHTTLIPFFASATFRVNGRGTEEYRRGNELQVSGGTELPIASRLVLIGQINARHLAKDAPGNTGENPNLTGGTFVYVSPGVRARISTALSFYAIVQLPAYQRVNGIQLTARRNLIGGVRFTR